MCSWEERLLSDVRNGLVRELGEAAFIASSGTYRIALDPVLVQVLDDSCCK